MTEYTGVVRMVHFVNRSLIGEDNSITIRPDLNYFNFIPSCFVNRSSNLIKNIRINSSLSLVYASPVVYMEVSSRRECKLWKVRIETEKSDFQLRSILANLINRNFVTPDFPTQNFPTSRFFQTSGIPGSRETSNHSQNNLIG